MNEEPDKNEEEFKENTEQENIKEEKKKISVKKVIIISLLIIALIYVTNLVCSHIIEKNNCKNDYPFPIPSNPQPGVDYKPIIYLYPEEETSLVVKLGNLEKLTCTYPKYKETGWNVTAYPDGKLIDNETGRSLYALYWEGLNTENIKFNDGFCVKGEDTIKFLEEKLEILGLNEREAEEFIVYWLPKMEDNKYNLIRFANMEEIEINMPLNFSLNPDTVIRVLMEYKPVDKYVDIPEQKIETPERTGFTVVEWGGTEVK